MEARLKIRAFFLFVTGIVLLLMAWNVWLFQLSPEVENAVAWWLLDTGILLLPISFRYIGKAIKQSAFVYVGNVATAFAANNLFDLVTGRQYVIGLNEYVFAAIAVIWLYYDARHNK